MQSISPQGHLYGSGFTKSATILFSEYYFRPFATKVALRLLRDLWNTKIRGNLTRQQHAVATGARWNLLAISLHAQNEADGERTFNVENGRWHPGNLCSNSKRPSPVSWFRFKCSIILIGRNLWNIQSLLEIISSAYQLHPNWDANPGLLVHSKQPSSASYVQSLLLT